MKTLPEKDTAQLPSSEIVFYRRLAEKAAKWWQKNAPDVFDKVKTNELKKWLFECLQKQRFSENPIILDVDNGKCGYYFRHWIESMGIQADKLPSFVKMYISVKSGSVSVDTDRHGRNDSKPIYQYKGSVA